MVHDEIMKYPFTPKSEGVFLFVADLIQVNFNEDRSSPYIFKKGDMNLDIAA